MRLYLLPISTRRTLIYCQKPPPDPTQKATYINRAILKAETTWTDWEKAPSGWKKTLTNWGNVVLRRIPFEEWGLKTVPALTNAQLEAFKAGTRPKEVEVHFPARFLQDSRVEGVFQGIATERQGLHRQRMIGSLIAAPLTLPFALIPIIPNIPGIYMVFRAYSHWRAWRGSQHLDFLSSNKLLSYRPSKILDEVYTAGLIHGDREASRKAIATGSIASSEEQDAVVGNTQVRTHESLDTEKEVMLLRRWNGKLLAESLKLPDMEIEVERAVEQVEASIAKDNKVEAEKAEAEKAQASTMEQEKKKRP